MPTSRALFSLWLLVALPAAALAQISPGPLSKAHKSLEGNQHCLDCHAPDKNAMDGLCLNCHAEIKRLRFEKRGFHAAASLGRCASCHPEHAGPDFDLIAWPSGSAAKFDHRSAGWPLEGKHLGLDCQGCHRASLELQSIAQLRPAGSKREHWTGLSSDCASCHRLKEGSAGLQCRSCHSTDDWRRSKPFDHAKTSYPLTGKHAAVDCSGCHKGGLERNQPLKVSTGVEELQPHPRFKGTPFNQCSACHQDPHGGRLGASCNGCHVTESFHSFSQGSFDHSKTRFPLRGAHASIGCAQCHDKSRAWGEKPPFATCTGCHKDPHAGQATLAGKVVDCNACHSQEHYSPAIFSVAQHAGSSYPLAGKHMTVACRECHDKPGAPAAALGSAGVRIRRSHERCTDCHADAHGGQLAGRVDKGACEACHQVGGFQPSTFKLSDHDMTAFPLDGAHAAAKCSACHGADRRELAPLPAALLAGTAHVALKLGERRCEECHRDPHGSSLRTRGCKECHDAQSFRSSRIDAAVHSRFGFALEGAHAAIPCSDCHNSLSAARPRQGASLLLSAKIGSPLTFHEKNENCADCHRDPHGGQFAAQQGGTRCDRCHEVTSFRGARRFDHQKTAFPLDGAHAGVACTRCHQPAGSNPDPKLVIYGAAPRRCEACHASKAGETKP